MRIWVGRCLCEARGDIGEAQQAYETAMKVEPLTTGARTNLAALLERCRSRARPANAQQMIEASKGITSGGVAAAGPRCLVGAEQCGPPIPIWFGVVFER